MQEKSIQNILLTNVGKTKPLAYYFSCLRKLELLNDRSTTSTIFAEKIISYLIAINS
jgi:hypothetical protein